jgi:hypothetical protein
MTNSVLLLKERIHNSQHRVMHNDGTSEVEISIFRVSTTPITSDWPEMLDFMSATDAQRRAAPEQIPVS